MKKILLWIIMLLPVLVKGQEDKAVTEMLKKKYGYVSYETTVYGPYSFYQISNNNKSGICDSLGNLIVPLVYDWVGLPKEKRYFMITNKAGKHGIYDIVARKELIKPKYDFADYEFYNDFKVKLNGKEGICNISGKEIIPPNFKMILVKGYNGHKPENVYMACPSSDYCGYAFNSSGKQIFPFKCFVDDVYDYTKKSWVNLFYYVKKDNQKIGVYDAKFKEILPCIYTWIKCTDSLFIVSLDGKYEELSRGQYDIVNGKWNVFNSKSEKITKEDFDFINVMHENLMLVNKGGSIRENAGVLECTGGKFGFLDKNGNLVIPCIYDAATDFKDGVAQVTENGVSKIIVNPLSGTNLNVANGENSVPIDKNIPQTNKSNDEWFAFIFANENYTNYSGSDYSINDGKVLKEYCLKTIGMPESNVKYYEDATFGNYVGALKKIKDIADAYDGDAKILVYFSGLGTTDPQTLNAYLLPSDASPSALSTTGYNLQTLITQLNALKTKTTLLILDVPFSGNDKAGKPLATSRGVRLSPKNTVPQGSLVICQAATQNENVKTDKKYCHGLLSYGLLQQLQQLKGSISVQQMLNEAISFTTKESLKAFDEKQTPKLQVSEQVKTNFSTLKF